MKNLARASLAAGLVASTALAGVGAAAPKVQLPVFDEPVRLTPLDGIGGFEPGLVLDEFDNVWVTAHRPYHPIAPDAGSPTQQRQSSWLWLSADGKTFTNPPGATPINEHELYLGGEGDLAADGSGNVYFIDMTPGRSAFASWRVGGAGKASQTHSTPLLPMTVAPDRPFIAAGGSGTLFITENIAGRFLHRDSVATGSFEGGGTAGFYVSTDGGKTLTSPLPYSAEGTGFCRPLIDRRDSRRLIAACLPDTLAAGSPLVAYTSDDTGSTWTSSTIGQDAGYVIDAFPSFVQTPEGGLHALFHRAATEKAPDDTGLHLFSSRDGGRTWSLRDVTPEPGTWQQAGLAAAPDGRLGLSGYYRKDSTAPWQYRAAVFSLRDRDVVSTEVNPGLEAFPGGAALPGEFTQPAFDSKGRLHVTYAAADELYLTSEKHAATFKVMYARQLR